MGSDIRRHRRHWGADALLFVMAMLLAVWRRGWGPDAAADSSDESAEDEGSDANGDDGEADSGKANDGELCELTMQSGWIASNKGMPRWQGK